MLTRRVRRVRAQARAGRAHRGERREPRPQAVPQPLGRRDPHPAGRPAAAAARRGRSGARARARPGNCAWGSFRSAANPVLRDITERVVIASKGRFDRALEPAPNASAAACRRESTIDADEFMAATLDVWDIPPESARRVVAPGAVPGRAARAADPTSTRTRTISCSTRSWDRARRWSPPRGSAAATSATTSTPPTSTSRGCACATKATPRHRAPSTHEPPSPSPTATAPTSRRARRAKARPRRRSPRSCCSETGFTIVAKNQRVRGTGVVDQLHRHRRRRRRVVLRRVGRVHEHARRAAAHRHGVEVARARARARAERARARSCSSPRTCRARAARATSRCATADDIVFDVIEMRSADGYETAAQVRGGRALRSGRSPDDDHRGRHRARDARVTTTSKPRSSPRPTTLRNVEPSDYETLLRGVEGTASPDVFTAALDERARVPRRARRSARSRPPLVVEWKGAHRAPGDEVVPADLRSTTSTSSAASTCRASS